MKNKPLRSSVYLYFILQFLGPFQITSAQDTKWIKNVEIDGIEYVKIRYSRNSSDTISIIGFMDNNNTIQGYPCKKGWIHFSKEMDLKLFCLSQTCEVENIMLPMDSWIINAHIDNFTTVVLPNDTIIQGYPVRGGGGVTGAATRFYKSGKLMSFFPSNNFVDNDVKFKKSIFNPVHISSDGTLTQN